VRHHRLSLLVASLSLLIAAAWGGAASAEPEEELSGAYLGIGPAGGFEDFDNTAGLDIDPAVGFDAWGGYRLGKWIAAELQLEYMNGFGFSFFGTDIDGQLVSFGGNLKLFPLASFLPDCVQPFLIEGPGLTWYELDSGFSDSDELDFSARFGGGIDVYVSDHIALQAASSYVLATGDLAGVNYVSVGLGLHYRY
jgi:hypothetical protein